MEAYQVNESEMEWTPADFPRGHLKLLYMDVRSGGQIMLLRLEPYCSMPAHSHISDEASFVLEGSVRLGPPEADSPLVGKGHFAFFPGGSEHGPFSTEEEEALIFNVFYGPLGRSATV